ncbi:hypothetical protein F2Q70_00029622 [Brassica cretica]|uniref:Uncharacterized protein n=1 Tax=Brassica cretica TaxID=69181 RepID=A0A8S9FP98_BRACR|nr:hypothetical protein F2Q70_00029622 [Brassica cretica]
MVKGIRQLRLNQDKEGTSSKELGECYGSWTRQWKGQAQRSWASVTVAGRGNGEAESARGSSESERLPDRLGWHGLMVSPWVKPISVSLLAKEPGLCPTGTRARARRVEMDIRQKDKDKEKEKDMNPGDRTPKVSGLGRFRNDVIGLWPDLTMIRYTMGRSDGLDRFRCKPLVGILGNGSDLDRGKAKEP